MERSSQSEIIDYAPLTLEMLNLPNRALFKTVSEVIIDNMGTKIARRQKGNPKYVDASLTIELEKIEEWADIKYLTLENVYIYAPHIVEPKRPFGFMLRLQKARNQVIINKDGETLKRNVTVEKSKMLCEEEYIFSRGTLRNSWDEDMTEEVIWEVSASVEKVLTQGDIRRKQACRRVESYKPLKSKSTEERLGRLALDFFTLVISPPENQSIFEMPVILPTRPDPIQFL
jgi:hypothetical protein